MPKKNFDFVGTDSCLIGTTRVNKEDYEFLEEMAVKFSWGKLATMQRMMIKFSKKNQKQFENFINDMRKSEEPLI